MTHFEILSGLPATGPHPAQFSPDGRGTHREGFAVRVRLSSSTAWVGNFQPGYTSYSAVFQSLNSHDLIVIAGGQAYVVNPETQSLRAAFGGDIAWAQLYPALDLFLTHNDLWFSALGQSGLAWESERLAWDGIQNVLVTDEQLQGEAWDAVDERWCPFTLDLHTGIAEGGAPTARGFGHSSHSRAPWG
jgi:hypothetical protein